MAQTQQYGDHLDPHHQQQQLQQQQLQQQQPQQHQQQQHQQQQSNTKPAGTITGMLADFSRALGNIRRFISLEVQVR
jgi:hypothetical protein